PGGCRGVGLWLAIIAAFFAVCIAIGIGVMALNVRSWGGDMVRDDLMPLIDTADLPEAEKAALRDRVNGWIEAYRDETMSQEAFIAEAKMLREDLLTRQPPPPPPAPASEGEGEGEEAVAGPVSQ